MVTSAYITRVCCMMHLQFKHVFGNHLFSYIPKHDSTNYGPLSIKIYSMYLGLVMEMCVGRLIIWYC
jgi:hypothetical protein